MREIKLTQDKVALVDDEDFDRVSALTWSAHLENKEYYYAVHSINCEGKKKQIRMHRFILNVSNPKIYVDHVNGDTLDNRKENLRLASNSENSRNLTRQRTNISGYRGVFKAPDSYKTRPWKAGIKYNNKNKHLGYFATPEEAARVFDKAAKELFGEFCGKLNFE